MKSWSRVFVAEPGVSLDRPRWEQFVAWGAPLLATPAANVPDVLGVLDVPDALGASDASDAPGGPAAHARAGEPATPATTAPDAGVPADEDGARRRAAGIIAAAEAQAQELLQAARTRGYDEGRAQVRAELAAEREQVLAEARTAADAIRAATESVADEAHTAAQAERQAATAAAEHIRQQAEAEAQAIRDVAVAAARDRRERAEAEVRHLHEQSRQALVDLALAVAGRILQHELSVRPEAVVGLVAAGLQRLRDEDVTLHLSPADLPLVAPRQEELRRQTGFAGLTLREDPALSAGDYLVRSGHGEVDGRLERQIEHVRRNLVRQVREGEAE